MFGEPLSSVGPGALRVEGAVEVLQGAFPGGERHHVVVLPAISRAVPAALARELNRLAEEGRSLDPAASGTDGVAIDEWRFVPVSTEKAPSAPAGTQRVIVVVREEPDLAAWKRLLIELGPRLTGVYREVAGGVEPIEIPAGLRRSRGAVTPTA